MADRRPAAVLLMGPTASGKTAHALDLAARLPFSIVSVDSTQVYRGLDIGSAKPDPRTLARFPHALIDLRDPEETYSAAEFRTDAVRAMTAITASGRVPLLVGGTMLYFHALVHGLSELPDADPEFRARLAEEAAAVGWAALHARLARLDPIAASRIHPNDPQRIGRALEVIARTGRPLSAQQTGPERRLPWRVLKIALLPGSRAALHRRIARRFKAMLEAGLVDEVRRLRARPGLTAGHPSMRSVGYRQAWAMLDGELSEAELPARGIEATRQLAKRQITWLRRIHDAIAIDPDAAGSGARLQSLVTRFLGDSGSSGGEREDHG
jgi:tRNA dimethylallyltransferase